MRKLATITGLALISLLVIAATIVVPGPRVIVIGPPAAGGGGDTMVTNGNFLLFWCDEATSGTDPEKVIDYGLGTAFSLTNRYNGELNYTESSGNSALDFTSTAGDSIAEAIVIDSDKVDDALEGGTQFTIEYVMTLDAGNGSVGRTLVVTADDDETEIGLLHDNTGTDNAYLRFNDSDRYRWTHDTGTRDVWHLIIDTTEGTESNRFKVFKNDAPHAFVTDSALGASETLTLEGPVWVCLGNRETSRTRQNDFQLFQFALYNIDFSDLQKTTNYNRLTSDDDAP